MMILMIDIIPWFQWLNQIAFWFPFKFYHWLSLVTYRSGAVPPNICATPLPRTCGVHTTHTTRHCLPPLLRLTLPATWRGVRAVAALHCVLYTLACPQHTRRYARTRATVAVARCHALHCGAARHRAPTAQALALLPRTHHTCGMWCVGGGGGVTFWFAPRTRILRAYAIELLHAHHMPQRARVFRMLGFYSGSVIGCRSLLVDTYGWMEVDGCSPHYVLLFLWYYTALFYYLIWWWWWWWWFWVVMIIHTHTRYHTSPLMIYWYLHWFTFFLRIRPEHFVLLLPDSLMIDTGRWPWWRDDSLTFLHTPLHATCYPTRCYYYMIPAILISDWYYSSVPITDPDTWWWLDPIDYWLIDDDDDVLLFIVTRWWYNWWWYWWWWPVCY